MTEERIGVDALRDAVETVATDLERRGTSAPVGRGPGGRRWMPSAIAAAAVVIAATVAWWMAPHATPEVEILELRIRGVAVQPVIVNDRAPETVVIMPSSVWAAERRLSPVFDIVEVLGEMP